VENTIRSPHWGPGPADLSAAIEAAAETLVIVWGRAQEALHRPVSSSQLRALLAVERLGEINLNGLAEELGSIPSSASRLCDRLQAAGLISRNTGRTDRREVMLSLTPDGHSLLGAMRSARRADIARVLAAMPDDDQHALLVALERFRSAATADGAAPDGPPRSAGADRLR
jgi:DNA-binding MarR family transcriptional regulator